MYWVLGRGLVNMTTFSILSLYTHLLTHEDSDFAQPCMYAYLDEQVHSPPDTIMHACMHT